jgi:hypothetical protein
MVRRVGNPPLIFLLSDGAEELSSDAAGRFAADVAQDALDQRHAFAAARLGAASMIDPESRTIAASGGLAYLALGEGIAETDIHRRIPR